MRKGRGSGGRGGSGTSARAWMREAAPRSGLVARPPAAGHAWMALERWGIDGGNYNLQCLRDEIPSEGKTSARTGKRKAPLHRTFPCEWANQWHTKRTATGARARILGTPPFCFSRGDHLLPKGYIRPAGFRARDEAEGHRRTERQSDAVLDRLRARG